MTPQKTGRKGKTSSTSQRDIESRLSRVERILDGMISRLGDIEAIVRESLDNGYDEEYSDWRDSSDFEGDLF
jgi:hypothetical protein